MRLRTRQQFLRMGQQSLKFTGQWVIVEIKMTRAPFSRLGITATKRFGDAHQRNRFKRLVREAFRLSCTRLTPTFDLVVKPRSQALHATLKNVQEELLRFIEQASS